MAVNITFDLYDIELQLADIMRAFETAEEGLASAPDREAVFIEAVLHDHPDATRAGVQKYLYNEAFAEIERSRQSICQAFVLANYSAFEFGVLRITENYLKTTSSEFKLKDFSGTGFEKFLIIARKLAKTELYNEELWELIGPYRAVRNQIAHNNGICLVEDEKNKILKAVLKLGDSRLIETKENESWTINVDAVFVRKMNSRLVALVRSASQTLEGAISNAHS